MKIKSRKEAVEIIHNQLNGGLPVGVRDTETRFTKRFKDNKHHYGKQELRELMDLIYGGEPVDESEEIK